MTTLTMNYASPVTLPAPPAMERDAWHSRSSSQTFERAKPALPRWIDEIRQRVRYLIGLKQGWDGYLSAPIQTDTLSYSLSILDSVMRENSPAPFLAPVSGGGIQIEWHEGGLDIELYISQPLKAELYVEYHDGREPLEMELVSDFKQLDEALLEIEGQGVQVAV
jgi:hypothetical protein